MTNSFYVKNECVEEVKAKIRTFPSFRFNGNPIVIGQQTNISISGDVKEMNEFSKWLEALEYRDKIDILKKKRKLNRLGMKLIIAVVCLIISLTLFLIACYKDNLHEIIIWGIFCTSFSLFTIFFSKKV